MGREERFFLSDVVRHSLKRVTSHVEGLVAYLHTFTSGQDVHMVGVSALSPGDNTEDSLTADMCLPAGVNTEGLVLLTTQSHDTNTVLRQTKDFLLSNSGVAKDTFENDILVLVSSTTDLEDACLYSYSIEDVEVSELQMSAADILDECILTRVRGSLPLTTKYNQDTFEELVKSEIEKLRNNIASGNSTFFLLENTEFLLCGEDSGMTCGDMLKLLDSDGEKPKKTAVSSRVANFQLLIQRTGESAIADNMNCAPVIRHRHGAFQQLNMRLPIDVAGYVDPTDVCTSLYYILIEGISSQLRAMSRCITRGLQIDQKVHTPEPFHFWPAGLGHLITGCYPRGVEEDTLEADRLQLHKMFYLPNDRPQVKRLNAYRFPQEPVPGGYLVNPHEGARRPGSGSVSVVQGQYTYHHYMQDKTDDNGWGCAYRSLQTIVSWFRLQGYTDKPIPSHKQIQQALVDVGDKNSSFVSSKKWIGSTEVSYVLDHLFKVTSKIMCVSSGGDLSCKGRELALHFSTQGTPIMVGGGVLAHTILGVDFNESTGDLYFLILDPHYTGPETLKVIQDKGWCSWKDSNFWDKNVYYNLCMPQRPREI